ncbi:Linalool 8-monooxygenase [Actinobacteria bacterium OK074]|nr:Linalool 8-monooxygenase [Actinobacteria bacterium OK074]
MTDTTTVTDTTSGKPGIPGFPMARDARCPFDPPKEYERLRSERPVARVALWDGTHPWLITRYADQRAILGDPRFSADARNPGYPAQSPSTKANRKVSVSFIATDDPEHSRYRQMLTKHFTFRRTQAMRPRIQRIVDGLIDDLVAGPRPVDLFTEFALPIPSTVICDLLGVPYADHTFFQEHTSVAVSFDASAEQSLASRAELGAYMGELLDAKNRTPGDDITSTLVVEQLRTGAVDRQQAVGMLLLLLAAGHETTANQIALGVLALLQHPDQLAKVRDADGPGIVTAVEELLRYLTIAHSGRRRVATEDVEIGGQLIRAGEGVVLPGDAGNRDGAVFENPDRLDVTRQARHHVAFGYGVHQCLGQPLARAELQVAYPTLLRRLPELRLAVPLAEIPFRHDKLAYGVYELPVTW